jgi:hypothetical protein
MAALTDSIKFANKPWVPVAVLSGVLLIAAALSAPRLEHRNVSVPAPASAPSRARVQSYTDVQRDSQALTGSSPVSLPRAEMIAGGVDSAAPSAANTSVATADRKLVRTGSLDLTVKSPVDAAEQIRRMAESMGGYLEGAQIGGTKEAPIADLTIRVPATRFEDAKAGIRQLAARIESEKTDARDVTRDYVDMEARLRNLRAEEAQYLIIMKSAYKVDDLLSVTEKLSEVRGQIEQQQAEFQTLSKQVETVAITISLRALADTEVFGLNWRPLYQLKVAARNGLDAIADYAATMTAILFYVPVILAWSVTILFVAVAGSRLVRWGGRRFFNWSAVSPQKAAGSI